MKKFLANILKNKNKIILIALTIMTLVILGHLTRKPNTDPNQVQEVAVPDDGMKPWVPFPEGPTTADHKTGTIYIGEISYKNFLIFEREATLMELEGIKNITIVLHSPGGQVFAANVIVEQMKLMREHGITFTTKIRAGEACMSACPLIYMAGDHRVADKTSVLMFHSPYNMTDPTDPNAVKIFVEKELWQLKLDYIAEVQKVCPANPVIKRDIIDHVEHFYYAGDYNEMACPGLVQELTSDPLPESLAPKKSVLFNL